MTPYRLRGSPISQCLSNEPPARSAVVQPMTLGVGSQLLLLPVGHAHEYCGRGFVLLLRVNCQLGHGVTLAQVTGAAWDASYIVSQPAQGCRLPARRSCAGSTSAGVQGPAGGRQ